MKEKNLRKEVLISNFLHSLKYRIKCNKDMIDKLYDYLYFSLSKLLLTKLCIILPSGVISPPMQYFAASTS